MRPLTRHRRWTWRLGALLVLTLSGNSAWACTSYTGGSGFQSYSIHVPVTFNSAPVGTVISPWRNMSDASGTHFIEGCPIHEQIAFTGWIQSSPLKPYGKVNVEGQSYTAYQLSDTSPLFVFRHLAGTRTGGTGWAIAPINDIHYFSNPGLVPLPQGLQGRSSIISFAVVARGHPMTNVPTTNLGVFETWPTNYTAVKGWDSLGMTIDVQRATCSLSDAAITLNDLPAARIQGPGPIVESTKDFVVQMRCDAPDAYKVWLTMNDVPNPTLTGSVLTSIVHEGMAYNVYLELLNGEGRPLSLVQPWGETPLAGTTPLRFKVRYYRGGLSDLRSGTIKAQARLTMTYN